VSQNELAVPAARRRPRRAGLPAVIAVTATTLCLAGCAGSGKATTSSTPSVSPAAAQFSQAYQAFHSHLAKDEAALNSDVAKAVAQSGISGLAPSSSFSAAQQEAITLQNVYQQYASAVGAIKMPAAAKTSQARIVQVAKAGVFLMQQANGFFAASNEQSFLNEEWPKVTTSLTKAETTIRATLGLA
jgi:hypothetical protein